jgi:hypothetical protein
MNIMRSKLQFGIVMLLFVAVMAIPLFVQGENLELARKVNEYEGQHLTDDELARKVNEYEGQHLTDDELAKVNEYEGQHLKVNEYEGQHR